MADNTTLNAGTGGDVIASDDIGGVKYQRVKPTLGADGTAVDSIAVSNGLDSTGAGIPANAIVGQFDDAATGTVTENNFAPARISSRRALLVEGVASGTAVATSHAAASQADGHSATIGATTDADTASTVIGRLKKLVALLPTALGGQGGLKIEGVASGTAVPVSNAGTFATQVDGAALTSLQLIDDAVHADDATRGKSLLMGAVLDDASPIAITENQAGYVRMSSRRALLVEGVASGTAQNVAIDSGAVTSLALIDDTIKADDAGFTVGTDKVNMAGLVAVAHGANPDAADANDAVAALTNRHRVPFSIGGHPNIVTIEVATTGAQTDVAIVTVSTGTKIVVTQCQAITDNANTAFPQLRVGFGTANTPTTTGVVLTHPGLPAGGGVSRGDGSGIIGIGADNEDLRYTCGAPTGGSLRILTSYFTIES